VGVQVVSLTTGKMCELRALLNYDGNLTVGQLELELDIAVGCDDRGKLSIGRAFHNRCLVLLSFDFLVDRLNLSVKLRNLYQT
jgi:hypothetical protein